MREELQSEDEELEFLVEGLFSRRRQGRPRDPGIASKRWLTLTKMLKTVGLGLVQQACEEFETRAPTKRKASMDAMVMEEPAPCRGACNKRA